MRKILALFGAIVMILGLSLVAFADDPATLSCTASTTQWCPGTEPEITITVSLQNAAVAKSMALTFGIGDQFNVVSGAWSRSDAFMANFDPEKLAAAMAFTSETNINGDVFVLKLQAKSAAAVGDATITVMPTIQNGAVNIACEAASVTLTVGHSLSPIAAVAATCTTDGNNEYYTCSVCKKVFKDADGVTETTVAAEKIPAGHSMTKIDAVPPCEKDGNNEYYFCSTCEKVFKDADGKTETTVAKETLPMSGHKGGTATCTEQAICEQCHQPYGKTLEHDIVWEDAVAGTQSGECSLCHATFTQTVAAEPELKDSLADDDIDFTVKIEASEDGEQLSLSSADVELVKEDVTAAKINEIKEGAVSEAKTANVGSGKKVKEATVIRVFDIYLQKTIKNGDDEDVSIKEPLAQSVKVTMKRPDEITTENKNKFVLVHFHGGTPTVLPFDFVEGNDDLIWFITDNFSDFVFLQVKVENKTSGSSGSSSSAAIYADLSNYKITAANAQNGKLLFSKTTADAGALVRVTALPNGNFKLDTLTVTDAKGNLVETTQVDPEAFTFKMPKSNVTVAATFVSVNAVNSIEKFTDCDASAWYGVGVRYCVDKGYMVGTTEDKFSPDGAFSRAMIVTMLWRMEGSPAVNYAMSFADVANGQWYTEAIRWAQSTGLVKGMSETAFCPNDNITREQLATIFANYAKMKGISVAADNDLAKFTDKDLISTWALDNLKWANAVGLVNGRTETTIAPRGNATRAEAAVIVQRFCENIAK